MSKQNISGFVICSNDQFLQLAIARHWSYKSSARCSCKGSASYSVVSMNSFLNRRSELFYIIQILCDHNPKLHWETLPEAEMMLE